MDEADLLANKEKLVDILMAKITGNMNPYEMADYLISKGVTALQPELPETTAIESRCDELEMTLAGVMHFVDKWLNGEELLKSPVDRAITMRNKTLEIVEAYEKELAKLRKQLADALLPKVEMSIYNKEEIFENCTVQVLTNTFTGKTSVGWWHGSASNMPGNGGVQYEE